MRSVFTVIGTRPQYLKYAALTAHGPLPWREVLVDTGQHYDAALSLVFREEYAIPAPAHTLRVGTETGLPRLATLLSQLDPLIVEHRPNAVLCFGDTDSTLAAGLAAARHGVPLLHVEAGERSRDRNGKRVPPAASPEETNRVTVDHLSSLLLCATKEAVTNLADEQVQGSVRQSGDIMLDLFLAARDHLPARVNLQKDIPIPRGAYALSTIHRAVNTDNVQRLRRLLDTLNTLDIPVLLPLHPRTETRMRDAGIVLPSGTLHVLPPLPHHTTLALLRDAQVVLTDSGGLTREAYFSGIPSICLDDTTAWYALCRAGWCHITGADPARIRAAVTSPPPARSAEALFGDGHAMTNILEAVGSFLR
ncbi:MAG: UDP-N-acetylglucosamine 2-epimerase [Bacteroidetes bacterium]|nr:UDP-N-acetylglucosamine 2-epimerase [Bacteroidota bacterium]